MNTLDDQDRELEAVLRRTADYLTHHGTEYLERSDDHRRPEPTANRRGRRVLVAGAAAAVLSGVAMAASFIGSTSSGEVDVAEAAWSAVPAAPTAEQVRTVQLDCGITVNQLATIENVPPASIPDYMLEPALVDVRGTTTTAVYFTWSTATLCIQFADGSLHTPQFPMASADEFAWREPTALDLLADIAATMIVGFLPPNTSGTDPDATSESEAVSESPWQAYVEGPGIERTKASVNGVMGRYVAWVPVAGDFRIAFVNVKTGEELATEVRTESLGWKAAPETTIVWPAGEERPASPND